jgi:hypothetical protein
MNSKLVVHKYKKIPRGKYPRGKIKCKNEISPLLLEQSSMCRTTTLGTPKKWSLLRV